MTAESKTTTYHRREERGRERGSIRGIGYDAVRVVHMDFPRRAGQEPLERTSWDRFRNFDEKS
ncbi:MAG: hypothetical protein ICV69_14600 [Thermoleophilaceae bacterium]|nr:hypothetical protein [Thermoleophilaceae bacterium]